MAISKKILKDIDVVWGTERLTMLGSEIIIQHQVVETQGTAFDDDTEITVPNSLKATSIDLSGYWDSTSAGGGDPDKSIFDALAGSKEPVTVNTKENDDLSFMLESEVTQYNIGGAIGEIFPFDVSWAAAGTFIRGNVLFDGTDNEDGGTALVLVWSDDRSGTVSSDEEVVGFLHVLDGASAGDTLDVTIEEEESDDSVITFDQVSGDTKDSQIKTASGPFNTRKFRTTWNISSGSDNWSFVVAAGIRSK